ncbi:MAG: ABC transporter substrate-binding protein [Chloroflexi bacterium]|nr:ABC transporter substrate-binding protein [Chloroflexota bacterium]
MLFKKRLTFASLVLVVVITLLTGCIAPAEPTGNASQPSPQTTVPKYTNWDDVLSAAKGTTVNWFMWGGSDTINAHVDTAIGGPLKEQYGITLNRVPVENTADAVNKVLNEKAAGKAHGGSIDLIWINGENFRTLKEANLLYGPFTDLLPNRKFVNWDNPALAYDFGQKVDGYEAPWASFQWVMEYNTKNVQTPPKTFEALKTWIAQHPGRFTYPAPPNHVGSAFVRQLFYWAAGSPDIFLQEFDQAAYDKVAPQVWDYLNAIKPNLWHAGDTYPELAAMTDLIANGEIDFNMEYDANRASTYIKSGQYPDSMRTFVFDSGTLANVSYVGIPYNANNPAGALVLANLLASPDYQIALTDPETGLGWMVAIDPTRLSAEEQAQLAKTPRGVATLPSDVLSSHAIPEARASWVKPIDDGWTANVLKK